MTLSKKILAIALPASLALSACATGLPTKVSRFQAMPAPAGQTFVVEPANESDAGSLEFQTYASLVRQHLEAEGYREAPARRGADFIVRLDYGIDDGKQQIVSTPSIHRPYAFHPFYSRFGYFGRRHHPFYYGWYDPFWNDPFARDVHSYTLYTSFVDLDIRRASDGQAVFEGTAKARSRTDELQVLVPNLVEAMFTDFPGRSGEAIRITVPDAPRR